MFFLDIWINYFISFNIVTWYATEKEERGGQLPYPSMFKSTGTNLDRKRRYEQKSIPRTLWPATCWTKKRIQVTRASWPDWNRGCPRGVMVKAMDCRIVEREFVLQSRYYVHFRANNLGKGTNPLILQAMGKIVPLLFF